MFTQASTAIMAMIILNFLGMLLVFLYISRRADGTQKSLTEQYDQIQLRLMELDARIGDLEKAVRASSDDTPMTDDDLGTLLEAHAARSAAQGRPSRRKDDKLSLDGFPLNGR